MPTRKRSTSTSKLTRVSKKISATQGENGPVPPYGDPIRQAIARGDLQEMRKVAASTRRWLKSINTLLARLERQIEKLSARK